MKDYLLMGKAARERHDMTSAQRRLTRSIEDHRTAEQALGDVLDGMAVLRRRLWAMGAVGVYEATEDAMDALRAVGAMMASEGWTEEGGQ